MNFGPALKEIRNHFKLTQSAFATKTGISQAAISQFENGEKNPSKESISVICAALRIPEQVVYLLAMKDAPVSGSRKKAFEKLYPHIKALTLELLGNKK